MKRLLLWMLSLVFLSALSFVQVHAADVDTDGDGIVNSVDLDDDNDGIPDAVEKQCSSILTGSWTETSSGSGIWESQTGSVGVRLTLAGQYNDFWGSGYVGDIDMDNTCTDFTSSETVAGHTAMKLSAAGADNLDNANITIEFFDLNTGNPVNIEKPVIHMGRYAGQDGGGNRDASQWNLQSGLTETLLSGSPHMVVNSNNQTFVDNIGAGGIGSAYSCDTGELSGSVQIDGTVNTIVYNVAQINSAGNPDGNSLDNLQIIVEACSPADTDGDGIPDHLDLDSDNDGISDLIESGQNPALDTNNSGVLDSTTDNDGDGLMAPADTDDDDNTSAGSVTPVDTDGDGIDDRIDLDSDNDGIPDTVEAQPTIGYQGNDGDVSDNVDANGTPPYGLVTPEDTDHDALPDYRDTDSDGDGTSDSDESGLTLTGNDHNNDGADDGVNTSYQNPDGDINETIHDLKNDTDNNIFEVDFRSVDLVDTDGDGIPDNADLDDDNDGIPDINESYCDQPDTANPDSGTGTYPDQLYIFDWTDASFADGLDVGDSQTFDLPNGLHIVATVTYVSSQGGDPHTFTPRELSQTWGAAKLHKLYNTPGSHEAFYSPSDNQDITVEFHFEATLNGNPYPIDLLALDAEATYVTNETLTYTSNGGAWQVLEQTGNGGDFYGAGTQTLVDDRTDQSDFSIYFSQSATNLRVAIDAGGKEGIAFGIRLVCDRDGDGIPNRLDLDSDNDGISDLIESGQDQTALDTDNDGKLDSTTDDDHDGLMDTADADDTNATSAGLVTPVDSDSDGINDFVDLDADNDGIPDAVEAQPTSGYQGNDGNVSDGVNASGIVTEYGLVVPQNTDGTDTPDYIDTNSDNDGSTDTAESGLTLSGNDNDNDGIDDAVHAGYQDPDGDVNTPMSDLANTDDDTSDVDYRSRNTPTATDDNVTVGEDSNNNTLQVVTGDNGNGVDNFGGDGAASSAITIVTGPAHGTASVHENGTANDPTDDYIVYTPDANYNGPDTLVYQIKDRDGDTSNATVRITVTAVNDAPEATDDSNTTDEDTTLTVPAASGVLSNDTDVDGDTLTVTGFTDGTTTKNAGETLTMAEGNLTLNGDGSYTFVPTANRNGSVPQIIYTVSDGNGGTDTAHLNITVTAVTDATTDGDETPSTPEETQLTGNLFANLTDEDSSDHSITGFTISGTTYTPGSTVVLTEGNITVNANGTYTFDPAPNFTGAVSQVEYALVDDHDAADTDTSTLKITVGAVNDAPEAADDSNTTDEDTTLSVDAASGVLSNDTDVDGDTLTVTGFTDGTTTKNAGETLTMTEGNLTLNADGSYTFVPAADYNGSVPQITYTVSDGNGGTDTAHLDITVTAVNDIPAVKGDTGFAVEDTPLAVDAASGVLRNDTDADGDTLTVTGFTDGTTTKNAGETLTMAEGNLTLNADGSYTFVPAADYHGAVPQITYTVSDGKGGTNAATINLTVLADNDGDGIPDATDLDSDNDGIADAGEYGTCSTGITAINLLEDFGSGSRTSTPYVNYCYEDGTGYQPCSPQPGNTQVNADEYTIVQHTKPDASNFGGWITSADHTGNTDGRMLVVNGDENSGEFYRRTIYVSPHVDVHAGFWVLNVISSTKSNRVLPNLTLRFEDMSGNVLGTLDTGDVAQNETWQDFNFSFSPGNHSQIQLVIISNASGVMGNDFAIDDIEVSQTFCDADGDGIPNHLDLDSDNDGISDLVESGQDQATLDTNNDGVLDSTTDADNDGLMDTADADDTNATSAAKVTPADTDGDGIDDFVDLDADNDGIPDAVEAQPTTGYQGNDGNVSDNVNANGIPPYGAVNPEDTDGDGTPDYLDTDSDNDGSTDTAESGLTLSGSDNDNDGIDDALHAGYQDPDGDVNDPINDLINNDSDVSDVDYRSTNNNVPAAADDTGTTDEDTTLTVNAASGVLSNDTDADGDTLRVTTFTDGTTTKNAGETLHLTAGDLTLNGDGSYTFVPAADYNGPVPQITYTVSDGNGGTDTAHLDIAVNPVDDGTSIKAIFWIDSDGDGVKDADEDPIAGATVELLDADGNPVLCPNGKKLSRLAASGKPCTTVTGADGSYTFENIPAAKYQIRFTLSEKMQADGFRFSTDGKKDGGTITLPADTTTGTTDVIMVAAAVNCECEDVASDGGDALGTLSLLLMMLSTAWAGLFFIRREEHFVVK